MSEVIRIARALRGKSQRDLATRSGINPATLSRLENGKRQPSRNHVRKIADALDFAPTHFETAIQLTGEPSERTARRQSRRSRTRADRAVAAANSSR